MEQEIENKYCKFCDETKNVDHFYLCGNGRRRNKCKQCDNEASKKYKANNKKHISNYNHEYKSEHKDISEYNKKYNTENREAIQTRQTAQHRERRKTDLNYAMACKLRRDLYYFIKNGKNDTIEKLIGCSPKFFYKWIKYQFDETMSFDNYGKVWEIDHVNPCCNYNLTKEKYQLACFHWSNMRPLDPLTNKKMSKNTKKEQLKHCDIISDFFVKVTKEMNKGTKHKFTI